MSSVWSSVFRPSTLCRMISDDFYPHSLFTPHVVFFSRTNSDSALHTSVMNPPSGDPFTAGGPTLTPQSNRRSGEANKNTTGETVFRQNVLLSGTESEHGFTGISYLKVVFIKKSGLWTVI